MTYARWLLAGLSVAGSVAVMAFAPLAEAGPPEGLADTPIGEIYSLAGQGYDVKISWDAGRPPNVPLALCSVTHVDTSTKPTATVSVSCPPNETQ